MMYVLGAGVAPDATKGADLIGRAARAGVPAAQHDYAWLLQTGTGAAKNEAEALKWYTRAAEAGSAPSQYNLALMKFKGAGGAADPVGALKWAMIAASGPDQGLKPKADKASKEFAARLTENQVADAVEAAHLWLLRHQITPVAAATP
jgi:TPR repeat protein